jgi:Ca2+-binding RTX toxin-like protein
MRKRIGTPMTLLATASLSAVFATTAFAAVVTGNDNPENLRGTNGSDQINGNGGDDRIEAYRSADQVTGGTGNDRILAGRGNDSANGNAGDDRIHGFTGRDTLLGEDGNDRLYGSFGDDTVDGGPGNDRIVGGFGNDTSRGGDGNDLIFASRGVDTTFGGEGNDDLWALARRDVNGRMDLTGDTLNGEGGDDRLHLRDGERDTANCGGGTGDVALLDFKDVTDGQCETVVRRTAKRRGNRTERRQDEAERTQAGEDRR